MTIGSLTFQNLTGRVQSAIAQASATTGVDFSYLLGQAQVESSLRPDAHAATSSASGLYQFIDQSWLGAVKNYGSKYGLGWASDAISQGSNGRFYVSDTATRSAIMKMRNDPKIASLMAAETASDHKTQLEADLGREVGGTDLYMAHFLGLAGARKFLTAMAANPDKTAASLFPAAAGANHAVFYGSNGAPRSLADIYDRFAAKLDKGVQIAAGGKDLPAVAGSGHAHAGFQLASAATTAQPETATLDQLLATASRPASLLRPTPDNARLAYMLLASMGA